MTAKEYLSQYKETCRRMDRICDDMERLLTRAAGASAIRYDKAKVQTSPQPDVMGEAIAELLEIEREQKAELAALMKLYREISRTISEVVDYRHREILHARYIELLDWKDITLVTGYSEQWLYALHGNALNEVDTILKNRVQQS